MLFLRIVIRAFSRLLKIQCLVVGRVPAIAGVSGNRGPLSGNTLNKKRRSPSSREFRLWRGRGNSAAAFQVEEGCRGQELRSVECHAVGSDHVSNHPKGRKIAPSSHFCVSFHTSLTCIFLATSSKFLAAIFVRQKSSFPFTTEKRLSVLRPI